MIPERWQYEASGGKSFPVQPGDVWRIGEHILACLDAETPAFDAFWSRHRPDVIFTDPPWNDGNCKAFRTKAGVSRPKVYWKDLMARLMPVWERAFVVYVEMGAEHAPDIRRWMERAGRGVLEWDVTYMGGHPAKLLRGAVGDWPYVGSEPTGVDDLVLPRYAIEGDTWASTVGDPCLGRGTTAKWAHLAGRRFVGTELHPNRMSCALSLLAALRAGTPELIERIEG